MSVSLKFVAKMFEDASFGTLNTEVRECLSMGGDTESPSQTTPSPDSKKPSKIQLNGKGYATRYSCGVCLKVYSSHSEAQDCEHACRWADRRYQR